LVKIGVDSSGKWGNPPIWIVASRRSITKGQICCTAHFSEAKYKSVAGISKNWEDKFKALLIFTVVSLLIYDRDIIIIHADFHGKTREYVVYYLRRLFQQLYPKRFPNKPLKKEPEIIFSAIRHSPEVKEADLKSSTLRHGAMPEHTLKHFEDPSLENQIDAL